MTRSFFAALIVGTAGMAFLPAYLQGCGQTGVGDPCVPEQEYDPTFLGFAIGEVNVESKSFDCQTRLCLANHFQGRVTCPYGQKQDGTPSELNGATPYNDKNGNPIGSCVLPFGGVDSEDGGVPPTVDGVSQAVSGTLHANPPVSNPTAFVSPQCIDRTGGTGGTAVYCSCRCANTEGKTDDGADYCSCPDGFTCTQLVTKIGTENEGLTGAYCIRNSTAYDPTQGSCQTCDPSQKNCGTFNGL